MAHDLTKFVVVKPLRVTGGWRVWESLNERVFGVFGYAKALHMDNGTEFDNLYIRKGYEEHLVLHDSSLLSAGQSDRAPPQGLVTNVFVL